ncbi:MAG: glycosyltransferase [Rhodobacteraceae bacterium]|nr:glycosyltransferase [Paracoccaceae bacterium]
MSDQIDCIVRFHDLRRLPELNRCLFSVVGQSYRPLRVVLVVQRFSDADLAALRANIEPLFDGEDGISLSIFNFTEPEPTDARSALMDLGIHRVEGRYFAFLDYDDTLYPEAYEFLIGQLKHSGAGIAFASVRLMSLDIFPDFIYTREKLDRIFPGADLVDLFNRNFAPLHSYVIDRSRVPANVLTLETSRTLEEDYDLLLRICAVTPSNFTLIGTQIGDYNFKSDGSNTVASEGQPRPQVDYDEIKLAMELRRRTTRVSNAVIETLDLGGLTDQMTIREIINAYSRAGKLNKAS